MAINHKPSHYVWIIGIITVALGSYNSASLRKRFRNRFLPRLNAFLVAAAIRLRALPTLANIRRQLRGAQQQQLEDVELQLLPAAPPTESSIEEHLQLGPKPHNTEEETAVDEE